MKPQLFLFFIPLFFACQKGDNDPVFSFRTRKARLTGEWKVVSYTAEHSGVTTSFEGDRVTYTYGDSATVTIPFTWTATFDGEGSYSFTKTEDYPADDENGAYTVTSEERGLWEFTGGNGSPSKSQLLLLPEEIYERRSDKGSDIHAVVIENPRTGVVYDMDELSNKTLVIRFDETTSFAFGQTVDKAEIKLEKQD